MALESLLTKKAEKSMFFMRQRMYEFANKPNRYLANLLRNRTSAQNISYIRDSTGVRNYDNKIINDAFQKFYKQIYSSQLNPLSEQDMFNFSQRWIYQRLLVNRGTTCVSHYLWVKLRIVSSNSPTTKLQKLQNFIKSLINSSRPPTWNVAVLICSWGSPPISYGG